MCAINWNIGESTPESPNNVSMSLAFICLDDTRFYFIALVEFTLFCLRPQFYICGDVCNILQRNWDFAEHKMRFDRRHAMVTQILAGGVLIVHYHLHVSRYHEPFGRIDYPAHALSQ